MSPEEDRTRDAVDSEPKHYQLSYSGPKLLFESGYKFSVPVDANASVQVVVTKKSNTIRNFPCTVLQCPVVLTSLRASLSSTTVSTLKGATPGPRGLIHETDLRGKLRPKHEVRNYRRKVAIHESGQREVAT